MIELAGDRGQAANGREAAGLVQLQRNRIGRIDVAYQLAVARLGGALDQRRQQGASDAAAEPLGMHVARVLYAEAIGRPLAEWHHLGVAGHAELGLAFDLGDDVWQAMLAHGLAPLLQVLVGSKTLSAIKRGEDNVLRQKYNAAAVHAVVAGAPEAEAQERGRWRRCARIRLPDRGHAPDTLEAMPAPPRAYSAAASAATSSLSRATRSPVSDLSL